MAKVRNPATFARTKATAHPLNRVFNRVATAVENIGVHVALQANLVPDNATSFDGFDAPVEAEDIVTRLICELLQRMMRALGK